MAHETDTATAEFYRSAGQWRWRVTALNGEIIGASTESYHNLIDAQDNFETLTGRVIEQDRAGDWSVLGCL